MATPVSITCDPIDKEELIQEVEFYQNVVTHSYDRSVLFIGITGQGKSSFCNFLLNEKKFNIEDDMTSCSDPSKQEIADIKDKKYLLVDTPGVCDTDRDPKIILSELTKAIFFVRKQGISLIAVVINPYQRMITELYDALQDFLERISPNIWLHMVVVFTHEKQTIKKHKSGDEYIKSILQSKNCPKFLKFISEHCNNRFLHVECETLPEDDRYWETKISEFTQYIDEIMDKTGYLKTDMMIKMENNHLKHLEFHEKRERLIQELVVLLRKPGQTDLDRKGSNELLLQINGISKEITTIPQIMKEIFILGLSLLNFSILGILGLRVLLRK